jgi:cell wall assembly regulator SMI1
MPRKPSVATTWQRFEKWLAKNLPEAVVTLNPPATKKKLTALEKAIGASLPDDFRESYLIHNGQDDSKYIAGIIYGLELLPTDGIINNWKGWADLESMPELDEDTKSIPAKFVQPYYFHRGWIPFTHDSGGNHLAIDLSPDTGGVVGQVIVFGRDDMKHYVLARSFSEFLRLILDSLEAGNFKIERNGDQPWYSDAEMIELKTKKPKVDHFHVAAADKRFNITGAAS